MKKFLLFVVALCSFSVNSFADGLTATLQHDDVMTAYYGVDAYKEAYAAAQNGDIITLSSGKFNDVSTISKSIAVIGAYAFSSTSNETTLLSNTTIAANGVALQGIYFSGTVTIGTSSLSGISGIKISRCWIEYLTSSCSHTNTVVDQCVVKNDNAIKQSKNYCIKNSTVGKFTAINLSTNVAYITNCVIWYWFYYSTEYSYYDATSCYNKSGYRTSYRPYAIYKNNILCLYTNYRSSSKCESISPSEFYNNVFCQGYMTKDYVDTTPYSYLDYVTVSYSNGCINENNTKKDLKFETLLGYPAKPLDAPMGSDGTHVGPYGGTGFSEYPSIPRITSKSIDATSNSEGKINVKITVKAEQ